MAATYSSLDEVRREFKTPLDKGTIITTPKIIEFQLQIFSLINSIIGVRYVVPITGDKPINRQDTVTFTTVAGQSGEIICLSTIFNGVTRRYEHIVGDGSVQGNSFTLRNAIFNLIVADNDRNIEPTKDGTLGLDSVTRLFLEGNVTGVDYNLAITDTSGSSSFVTDIDAVFGDLSVRQLGRIEAELVAIKIASILRTKVADVLKTSGVRQDINPFNREKLLMDQLNDIANGSINLQDAEQVTAGTGLESNNQSTGFSGVFDIQSRQW